MPPMRMPEDNQPPFYVSAEGIILRPLPDGALLQVNGAEIYLSRTRMEMIANWLLRRSFIIGCACEETHEKPAETVG